MKLKFRLFRLILMNILKSLFISDNWKNLEITQFLIIRKEEDLSFNIKSKKYSTTADSIKFFLDNSKISSQIICRPYAYSKNINVHNKYFSLNYAYLKISLYKYLFKFFINEENIKIKRIKLWKKLFFKSKPKVIICIEAQKEICAAANQLNIRIYDYQHGQINEYNPSYSNKLFNTKNIFLPTGYLCWDSSTKKYLLNNFHKNNKKIKVIEVGNLWFKRFIKKNSNDYLIQGYQNIEFGKYKNRILVSLMPMSHQVNIIYSDQKNNYISDELIKLIKEDKNFYWCLRVHPLLMNRKNLKKFENFYNKFFKNKPNVDWKLSSYNPLPVLLQNINLHITEYSNVTIEASMMNIKTALINNNIKKGKKLENIYIQQRNEKKAFVVKNNKNEILKWINFHLNNDKETNILKFPNFQFNDL